MAEGTVKSSKAKILKSPEGTTGLDGQFHVYVYDVFHETFLPGKSFETIERAVTFQRREQERIYAEQEAEPELFDFPFISTDSDLLARIARDPEYKSWLMRELSSDARARGRKR